MRVSLAELAGAPRDTAAAGASGTADPHATAGAAAHNGATDADATAGTPGDATTAASSTAPAGGTAPAASSAPLGVLHAELRRRGSLTVVDEELGKHDVGEFFLSEGDHRKRLWGS